MAEYIIKDLLAVLRYLPYGLIAGALAAFVLGIVNRRRGRKGKTVFSVAAVTGFFMYLAIMLFITFLSRESGSRDGIDLELFSTWGINKRNNAYVVENVLLFIPLGFICPWAFCSVRNPAACTMLGMAVSVGIECLQLLTKRGYFQIDDILTNTLGMAVGYVLFWCVSALKRRRD